MVVTLRAPPLTDAVGDFGHGDVGDVNFGDARKAKAPLLLEGGVRVVGDEACKEEGGGGGGGRDKCFFSMTGLVVKRVLDYVVLMICVFMKQHFALCHSDF